MGRAVLQRRSKGCFGLKTGKIKGQFGSGLAWAGHLAILIVFCVGCEHLKSDPEKLFRDAEHSYQRGDFALAQSQAADGYERSIRTNPELAGRFRLLQARATLVRGMYSSALEEFANSPTQVFATCDISAQRYILSAFANAYLGRHQEAELSVRSAETQCASPGPALAADLANMRAFLKDPPAVVEKDYLAALALARGQGDTYREAGALLNLGNDASTQEHYDESIDWNRASLQISKRLGYRFYEEKAAGNLAWDYYKLGDFERSAALFTEAKQKADLIDAGYDRARWRTNLGLLHENTGEFALAEADYRQALSLARQQGDRNQTTVALIELAFVSISSRNWDQAEKLGQDGLELASQDHDRPLELQALLAQGLVAAHRGEGESAEKLLVEVAGDPHYDRQSLRWEAQAALADLYAKEQKTRAAEAEYLVALETIRQARCSINREEHRLSFFANATRVYDSYIDFLVQEGKTLEALRAADESRALTLAEGLGVEGKKCLAAEAIFDPRRSARQTGATILFYWLGAEHSYLWAVAPDRLKLYPLPPEAKIEPAIQAYRKALVGSRDVLGSADANGAWLYQTLVAPAAEFFHPEGRVIVITDGSLSGLSFETLIAPQPRPHYWIEDVTLGNASSLRLLLAAAPEKHGHTNGKLLLMGNSVPPSDGEFGALPNAAEEMRNIRKYFTASDEQIYERDSSTASAYLNSHPEQFAYIHFVAHGTASLSDPLDSAVVLSPSPSEDDGGYKLYARDVITRPLNAELVTVSTCQGAGVRSYTGEGLVGLSWAFLHAGAHHVIGALWDVSDASTSQLMDAMYAQLVKGSSPDAALRAAKLSLLHSEAPFRKPYYWAAFQLYAGS